jgi:N-acetylglucosaminyl-diphospho-decaprenol L-rhamnosyltransferase
MDRGKVAASRLAAVVLNFRTPQQTRIAVESLLASSRAIDDLIVVNNDRPGTEIVGPRAGIRVLETGRNLGFSGGINVGIRAALAAGADRVLLVNSDVTVPPDCVEQLEHCLDSSPAAGIAGPVVVSRSDPSRVISMGLSYSTATGRMRQRGHLTPVVSLNAPAIVSVDAVAGCLMLVSRGVFEAVGLFDEDFFFSFEDLDFCLKARRAGFATVLAGKATVYHEGSGSIGVDSPRRLYFAARNHLLAAARSDPSASPLKRALRGSSIVLLNLAHAANSLGTSPVARVWAVIRGTADYFAGRYGDAGT